MKDTFWNTRTTDSIIKSGHKDTEASIITKKNRKKYKMSFLNEFHASLTRKSKLHMLVICNYSFPAHVL